MTFASYLPVIYRNEVEVLENNNFGFKHSTRNQYVQHMIEILRFFSIFPHFLSLTSVLSILVLQEAKQGYVSAWCVTLSCSHMQKPCTNSWGTHISTDVNILISKCRRRKKNKTKKKKKKKTNKKQHQLHQCTIKKKQKKTNKKKQKKTKNKQTKNKNNKKQ